MSADLLVSLILLFPLAGTVVLFAFGRRLGSRSPGWWALSASPAHSSPR
jgi:hypothetical protein